MTGPRAGPAALGGGSKTLKIRTYVANIQGRGKDKIPQLSARTSDSDFIVLNETNAHPGDESSIGLSCCSFLSFYSMRSMLLSESLDGFAISNMKPSTFVELKTFDTSWMSTSSAAVSLCLNIHVWIF